MVLVQLICSLSGGPSAIHAAVIYPVSQRPAFHPERLVVTRKKIKSDAKLPGNVLTETVGRDQSANVPIPP